MKPQTLPATCELCGNWLPGHSSSCPRSGVPPSQWKDVQFSQNVEQLDAMDVNDQDEILSTDYLDQVGFNTD
ncbi:hypothetical protein INT46_002362 [Mucor plumbeus]|uniref:Uncharacterized protein n=1 Tax=Mucor plumbeus TaxID=97098 RepID=A0A8H7UQ80_9FUNG|nr:hypothetical protein INT46_002362 [Mucor plumbeus]